MLLKNTVQIGGIFYFLNASYLHLTNLGFPEASSGQVVHFPSGDFRNPFAQKSC